MRTQFTLDWSDSSAIQTSVQLLAIQRNVRERGNFCLPPQCGWDLRSFVLLRSVGWYLFTDVSWQHISSIFKRPAVQKDCFTAEDGTDKLSRNVCKQPSINAAWQLKTAQTLERGKLPPYGSKNLQWIRSFPKSTGHWLASEMYSYFRYVYFRYPATSSEDQFWVIVIKWLLSECRSSLIPARWNGFAKIKYSFRKLNYEPHRLRWIDW
jgi:hypothetical protein